MINKKVYFQDWGVLDYQESWDQQEVLFKGVIADKTANRTNNTDFLTDNYLIFVEHPHVYTLGKSGHMENVLLNESDMEEKEIEFFRTNRGGDITFHGLQQIVGYQILDLYLRTLEEAVILTLAEYGISAGRSEGFTGVWLDVDQKNARKICALGVRSSRWVTMHGFALNVNANLDYFTNIIPCGIENKEVTSMHKELGREVDMDQVKDRLKNNLAFLFEMVIV